MRYYLCLGSNLGRKTENLARAVDLLRERGVAIVAASSVYRTEPVGEADQPWFLNQVVAVETSLDPAAVLRLAKRIESEMGRTPAAGKGPRPVDIDILLAGSLVLETPDLMIPHPRLARRKFVLVPLREIAPDAVHPLLGRTIAELADRCPDPSEVIRIP